MRQEVDIVPGHHPAKVTAMMNVQLGAGDGRRPALPRVKSMTAARGVFRAARRVQFNRPNKAHARIRRLTP